MMNIPDFRNNGQMIAPGWDNIPGLKNITAYFGTDGRRFAPVVDRSGYSEGVEREMNNGGVLMSGMPTIRFRSPWISDGQLAQLRITLLNGGTSGNVTFAAHIPGVSVGVNDTTNFNGKLNLRLNQLQALTRQQTGYRDYIWEIRVVEVLV